jgi:hypothetical protein
MGSGDDVRGVLVAADGSGSPRELARAASVETECCAAWIFSPDDSQLLGRPGTASGQGAQQVTIDIATKSARATTWTTTSNPTWQRVAR